jgi:hypothetical protein
MVPHHARITCAVGDEEAHVPRILGNHSPENDGTMHLSVWLVRQLVLSVDHIRCPKQTLM